MKVEFDDVYATPAVTIINFLICSKFDNMPWKVNPIIMYLQVSKIVRISFFLSLTVNLLCHTRWMHWNFKISELLSPSYISTWYCSIVGMCVQGWLLNSGKPIRTCKSRCRSISCFSFLFIVCCKFPLKSLWLQLKNRIRLYTVHKEQRVWKD